jgi:microcystin-dependent protein
MTIQDGQIASAADVLALVPVGMIVAYGGSTAPTGWALCDGTVHGSTALQAVIGTTTTPDLRGKFVLAASTTHPKGQTGGEETHVLTVAEMPSHDHAFTPAIAAFATPGSNDPTQGAGQRAYTTWGATDRTGGGTAHNNMPPYYALTYIIKK